MPLSETLGQPPKLTDSSDAIEARAAQPLSVKLKQSCQAKKVGKNSERARVVYVEK